MYIFVIILRLAGVVFEVEKHSVDLVELPFLVFMPDAELVAVRLANRAVFVRPLIPDFRVQIADIVAFFLPNPQKLVNARLDIGAADCEYGELLLQVISVHYTEFFYRVRGRAVAPFRADVKSGIPNSVL